MCQFRVLSSATRYPSSVLMHPPLGGRAGTAWIVQIHKHTPSPERTEPPLHVAYPKTCPRHGTFVSSRNTQPKCGIFHPCSPDKCSFAALPVPHIPSGQSHRGAELALDTSPWYGEVLLYPAQGFPLARLTTEAAAPVWLLNLLTGKEERETDA